MLNAIDENDESDASPAVQEDKKDGQDYVEESDTPDGRHIRKEVH